MLASDKFVSPAVLYMVSDLSKDKTGKFLFVGVADVCAELAIRRGEGTGSRIRPAPELHGTSPKNEDQVFLPEDRSPVNIFG